METPHTFFHILSGLLFINDPIVRCCKILGGVSQLVLRGTAAFREMKIRVSQENYITIQKW
jgi:hypothetical protein